MLTRYATQIVGPKSKRYNFTRIQPVRLRYHNLHNENRWMHSEVFPIDNDNRRACIELTNQSRRWVKNTDRTHDESGTAYNFAPSSNWQPAYEKLLREPTKPSVLQLSCE